MKRVFLVAVLASMAYSCTPDTNVNDETKEYESIAKKIEKQSTDKDEVPSGGDKGGN